MRANTLALYDAAKSALSKAKRVDEAARVRDQAQRIRLYARQAKDRRLIADAAELQLRATRRIGELIEAAKQAGQVANGRPGKNPPAKEGFPRVTLERVGVDYKLSSEAQKLARLAPKIFAGLIGETREKILAGGARVLNPQSAVLVRDHKERRREEVRQLAANPLLLPTGPFAAGVCDPPWDDPENPIGFSRRHYAHHYPLMAPAAIAALPVCDIFGPKALLLMWITRYHLARASHRVILTAWGFDARTVFTWNKEIAGLGRGFARDVTEHLVLGVRGDFPAPDDADRQLSLFSIKKTRRHSAKPDWPEQQIERWLPAGSFVQLFHRGQPRAGWVSWGHDAQEASK